MAVRRDALQEAVRMIAKADRITLDNTPQAVATDFINCKRVVGQ